MKYWLGKDSDTKIVAVSEKEILLGNPTNDNLNSYIMKLNRNEVPSELFSIPISYIRNIEMKNIDDEIKIYFGKESIEIIKIRDTIKKEEIFEVLKNISPKFKYNSKEINKLRAARKPLIALFVLTVIFSISYYMAILLERNELYGQQIAILLAIASLGSKNIIKIFVVILTIISIGIYRSKTHILHYIKRKN